VHDRPHGLLTITAPVLFGQLYVAPLLGEFLDLHRDVSVRALFVDRVVSMAEEGIDVAVRIGELPDSSMTAQRVGVVRRVVCGSPALLAEHGAPATPADVPRYRVVAAANVTNVAEWRFAEGDKVTVVRIRPALAVTSNQAAIAAAERGFGLTRLLSYQVADAVRHGRLVIVLARYELPPLPIHVVYAHGRRAAAKVRAFVEFCARALRAHSGLRVG
jgi:DNA-binding transcriptional LysR family regulator